MAGRTVHMHAALLEKEYDPDLGRISVLAEISRPRECTSVHPSPSPVCRNASEKCIFSVCLSQPWAIFSL